MKIGISIVVMLLGIFAVVSCTQLTMPSASATPTLPTAPQVAPATPLPPTVAPTATPVPTIALPTVTPSPTPDPDAAFLDWLASNGYEFLVDVKDGSKRYRDETTESAFVIDVYPDRVSAWDLAFDGEAEAAVLHESTNAIYAALEAYGYDATPVREALAAPHQYPVSLQLPGYLFTLEKEERELYSLIIASVSFFDSE